MSRKPSGAELHDLSALYALGALNPKDREGFEEHLNDCSVCAAEVRSLAVVSENLGGSVPAAPPSNLRERVLAKIHNTPQVPGLVVERGGILVARSEEMAWRQMAPGIQVKPLYRDNARKYHTSLVRMEAGAHYPSHRHCEVEELFILSGDLHVEGETVYAGDYCRAEAGTIHGEAFTDNGVLFLLTTSQLDEVIA